MSSGHRILCVDDDARLARLLVEDLRDAGYDVRAASDAAAGIEAFFTHAPSLVLCDIRMPGVSGFDLFARLHDLSPNLFGTAFIFLTALADRESELRARRLGADDFIAKPVDYEILREVIRVRLGARPPGHVPPPLSPQQAALLADWAAGRATVPPTFLAAMMPRTRTEADALPSVQGSAQSPPPMPDCISIGVLILDSEGNTRYANETASCLLGRARAELIGRRAPASLAAFARQHVAAARADPTRFSAARLTIGPDAAEVTAIARMSADQNDPPARVTIMLPVSPPARPAFAELLGSLFGFTLTEGRLAAELSAGATLSDIADGHGVAVATVRSQLKSVFGKVGVTRQSDLVRTLMVLQVVAGTGA